MSESETPDTVEQVSPLSFDATLKRLTEAITGAGMTIFADLFACHGSILRGFSSPAAVRPGCRVSWVECAVGRITEQCRRLRYDHVSGVFVFLER